MVLCIIALPIFAIMGIFSAKYRKLTRDSLECIFKTATLRKCTSGLDKRIQSNITGSVLKYSPKLAKIIHKNFAIFSWLIAILFVWSLVVSGMGVYNFALYGNCNGPDETGFCVFDPTGANSGTSNIEGTNVNADCNVDYTIPKITTKPGIEYNDPILGNIDANFTIIEYGCYTCPYTKKTVETVNQILELYPDVNVQFRSFVIPTHEFAFESALAADCAFEQNKYDDFHKEIFSQEKLSIDILYSVAEDIYLDMDKFDFCMTNKTYLKEVNSDTETGVAAGVVATPTFFIGDEVIVGTKPLKTFKRIIKKEKDGTFFEKLFNKK